MHIRHTRGLKHYFPALSPGSPVAALHLPPADVHWRGHSTAVGDPTPFRCFRLLPHALVVLSCCLAAPAVRAQGTGGLPNALVTVLTDPANEAAVLTCRDPSLAPVPRETAARPPGKASAVSAAGARSLTHLDAHVVCPRASGLHLITRACSTSGQTQVLIRHRVDCTL